uniref:U20-Theriditoxin-Lha1a_1 n=1 Tax=Latrodectus hasselti TaxID=256736 RepID=A0A482ZCZ2_LATHA
MLKLICIAFLVTVLTLVAGQDSLDPAEYACASDINQEELLIDITCACVFTLGPESPDQQQVSRTVTRKAMRK